MSSPVEGIGIVDTLIGIPEPGSKTYKERSKVRSSLAGRCTLLVECAV